MKQGLGAALLLAFLCAATLSLTFTGQAAAALVVLSIAFVATLWRYRWRELTGVLPADVGSGEDTGAGTVDPGRIAAPAARHDGKRFLVANASFEQLSEVSRTAQPRTGSDLAGMVPEGDRPALLAMLDRVQAGQDCPPRVLRWAGDLRNGRSHLLVIPCSDRSVLVLPGAQDSLDAGDLDQDPPLTDRIEQTVFQTDPRGALRHLSAGWRRLTGFDPRDGVGQLLVSHLHPADREDARRTLALVECGRKDHLLMEVRLLAGDGTLHWVELRASAIVGRTGAPEGAAGTVTDITRRRQLEESLRSSRRRLNTLLANVPGMVYRGRHDRNWTMEFVSDGCFDLTGYEPQEIVDNGRVSFGELIHPDDREFVWALVDTQLAQTKSFQLSYRIVDAAGEVKWVWEQGRGIFSSSGELLALEGFITDVSARRGAEEQAKRRLWFDARTGLASRTIFDDRLSFMLEHGRLVGYRCAVLWVDLDNFGEINARFGRDFGDRVLAAMARRFKMVQGPGATVSRVGGDEFAVLVTDFRLAGATSALPAGRELNDAAMRLAETIARALREPLRLDGRELDVSASIGVAVRAEHHVSGDALLGAARRASADARTAGTGQWRFAED